MQARSTCLHPIHGSTPSYARNCNGAQPVFSAPATLGTVPEVGSPLIQLTIGFCSIQGARLRTQHHPLIGPLQLTDSCIPCTGNRQQTGLCSRRLQTYILQHQALLGSSTDPRSQRAHPKQFQRRASLRRFTGVATFYFSHLTK